MPFLAGAGPAGICGTGDATGGVCAAAPALKRSLAAAALGGAGAAAGSGGGGAGFGSGGGAAGLGAGGGSGVASSVAESSFRTGVATVASGSSLRSTRNASAPKRSSCPFLSACSAMRRLLRYVPLALPWSTTHQIPPRCSRRACLLDTEPSATTISQLGSRPTTVWSLTTSIGWPETGTSLRVAISHTSRLPPRVGRKLPPILEIQGLGRQCAPSHRRRWPWSIWLV